MTHSQSLKKTLNEINKIMIRNELKRNSFWGKYSRKEGYVPNYFSCNYTAKIYNRLYTKIYTLYQDGDEYYNYRH